MLNRTNEYLWWGEGCLFSLKIILDKVSQCIHIKACVFFMFYVKYVFYVVVVFLLRNKKTGNMVIPVSL